MTWLTLGAATNAARTHECRCRSRWHTFAPHARCRFPPGGRGEQLAAQLALPPTGHPTSTADGGSRRLDYFS